MQVCAHETGSKVNFGTQRSETKYRAINTVYNMYSVYSKNLVTAKLTVAEILYLETTSLAFSISGFSKNRYYNRLNKIYFLPLR